MINGNHILFALCLAAAGMLGWTVGHRKGREGAPEYVSHRQAVAQERQAKSDQDISEMKFSDDPAYDTCQKILWLAEDHFADQWAVDDRVSAAEYDPDRR